MRRAKLALIVLGVLWLAGWLAWGAARGFDGGWIAVGVALVAAYAVAGSLSFRGERGRLAGVSIAAVLTLAVGIISFFHIALVGGGIAVLAGCALRPA